MERTLLYLQVAGWESIRSVCVYWLIMEKKNSPSRVEPVVCYHNAFSYISRTLQISFKSGTFAISLQADATTAR